MSILRRITGEGDSGQSGSQTPGSSSMPPARVPMPSMGGQQDKYTDIKNRVQTKLLTTLNPQMDVSRVDEVRRAILEPLPPGTQSHV